MALAGLLLVGAPLLATSDVGVAPAILAAAALLLVIAGLLTRRAPLVTASLVVAATEYLSTRAGQWPALDAWAAVYAAALYMFAELAFWLIDQRWTRLADPDIGLRHASRVAGLAVGAAALDGLLLLAAKTATLDSLVGAVIGGGAAVACLATVAWLARR